MTPHHAYPDVSWTDLRTELLREIASRRTAFQAMVTKGRITRMEADRELDLFQAILEDVERFRKAQAPMDQGKPAINPLALLPEGRLHAYTWQERRAALTRELEYRERIYPAWIQKGRLTATDASLQTRRLTCLRALYELGWDFIPRTNERALGGTLVEWLDIETEIAARDGRAQQEMAL